MSKYHGYAEAYEAGKNAILEGVVHGIPLDRLREICTAERDERVVVLPCKVGDTVMLNAEIMGCYIGKIPYTVKGIGVELVADCGCATQERTISLSEAEAALAKEGVKP